MDFRPKVEWPMNHVAVGDHEADHSPGQHCFLPLLFYGQIDVVKKVAGDIGRYSNVAYEGRDVE